jgi:hypothetical protein
MSMITAIINFNKYITIYKKIIIFLLTNVISYIIIKLHNVIKEVGNYEEKKISCFEKS